MDRPRTKMQTTDHYLLLYIQLSLFNGRGLFRKQSHLEIPSRKCLMYELCVEG